MCFENDIYILSRDTQAYDMYWLICLSVWHALYACTWKLLIMWKERNEDACDRNQDIDKVKKNDYSFSH